MDFTVRKVFSLVVAAVAATALYKAFAPGRTPSIRTPNGIASLEKVALGGTRQWILIRGEDASNPVLLFLHGGPGTSMMPVAHHFGHRLEQGFVVVHWDQRGTGKSYNPAIPEQSLTIEQFLSDTQELVELLRARFGVERIYLIGHSWGSILGIMTVQRHPELFHAYVGMGQVTDERRSEHIGLQYVRDRARELGNQQALQELAGLDMDKLKDAVIQRKWLSRFGGDFYEGKALPLLSDFDRRWVWSALRSPEYSWLDLLRFQLGFSKALRSLFREFKQVNFMRTAARLDVPVYFFMGRHDHNKHPELVSEYYEMLEAPRGKHLIWFDKSGHSPCLEEPEQFAEMMISRVLKETYPQ
jgi:pimeloyl-ACP methyl ester carboxylesterase